MMSRVVADNLPSNASPLLALLLDRLRKAQEVVDQLASIVEHYCDAEQYEHGGSSPEWRRSELVCRSLLCDAGHPTEETYLGYELEDVWHLGVIATGTSASDVLQGLKVHLGCELLMVSHGQQVWAWFGGPRQLEAVAFERASSSERYAGVSLACGEPCLGIAGWRLTHRQAVEAQRVAVCRPQRITWYADVALLAVALQNDTLAQSLKQRYMVPLCGQKDRGVVLRTTLRSYIDADCSSTSAESVLHVGRHTVARRVRTAEQLVGRAIPDCSAELGIALWLEEINERHDPSQVSTVGRSDDG
jgi:hypothetical protein